MDSSSLAVSRRCRSPGHQEAATQRGDTRQLIFMFGTIIRSRGPPRSFGQSTDDEEASVIEFVANDKVALLNKRKHRPRVRCETRFKRDGRFSPTINPENLLRL